MGIKMVLDVRLGIKTSYFKELKLLYLLLSLTTSEHVLTKRLNAKLSANAD